MMHHRGWLMNGEEIFAENWDEQIPEPPKKTFLVS